MAVITAKHTRLPASFNAATLHWLLIGGDVTAVRMLRLLLHYSNDVRATVVAPELHPSFIKLAAIHPNIGLEEKNFEPGDCKKADAVIITTGNKIIDENILSQVKQQGLLAYLPAGPQLSDFIIEANGKMQSLSSNTYWLNDKAWKRITSKIIIAFSLMVAGYFAITYLPLPSAKDTWLVIQPHITYQLLFFVLAGFLAQMVDGILGMGYGVTSATCLMAFGVNPVAMSASIHTSEIFTTGVSGYSHYRFGNVNKKLFKHLVIPGVTGAVAGALLLVYLGEKYGKMLMPVIALYAGFLGLRILFKAFREPVKGKKVKRIGWLAAAGGFLDSFGGGGWGPIVTSSLMAKGRSPKYTIGSVNLTEFFVTLSSAFAFFITIGISHWTIVLGLLTGGSIAAPIAARITGKLPRKTMMIGVGLMVITWCIRMIVKSL
jgi:uncharacterized membrane protein YfcA